MRVKKSTLTTITVIGLFAIGTIASINISRQASIANFINQRNKICSNLSLSLTADEAIDKCYCYFEGFKTGNEAIDTKTTPLCSCECTINGTIKKIGVLEARV